jgi:hypothetical protein
MRFSPDEIRVLAQKEHYVIPEEVMETIRTLMNRSVNKTPYKKRDEMAEVLTIFNNVTEDNFEMQYIKLIGLIQTPQTVCKLFFDKVNIKYALAVYATIYSRLMTKFSVFTTELDVRADAHLATLRGLCHVEPATYDDMCVQKEATERRLNMTSLFLKMKHPALTKMRVTLVELIRANLTLARRNEVDEWVDHLVLVGDKRDVEWIQGLTLSVISSRSLFRLQDFIG